MITLLLNFGSYGVVFAWLVLLGVSVLGSSSVIRCFGMSVLVGFWVLSLAIVCCFDAFIVIWVNCMGLLNGLVFL